MLISKPSCLINNSKISLWPSLAAQINAILLNVRVKFHKSFNFLNIVKKVRFEYYECF